MNNVASLSLSLIVLLIHTNLANAQNVELSLIDRLDGNLSNYCLDIVGGGANIDPANGLQAHTCYSYRGALGSDQAIDPARIKNGEIHLVEFDLCATVEDLAVGNGVSLKECDGGDLQHFIFAENGNINPKSANDLCVTAGQETTFGRNGTSPHQIKSLTLETCQTELAAYQQWRARSEDD